MEPRSLAVRCGNCGADVPLESLSDFAACGHCGTALYIGRAEGFAHLMARPVADRSAVPGLLARKLADMEIAGSPAEVESTLVHVPYWRVPGRGGVPRLVAAACPGASGLDEIAAPGGGELAAFDAGLVGGGAVLDPEVALDDVSSVSGEGDPGQADTRPALVHVPIHRVSYRLGGREYRAAIEAISGAVEADEWPPASHRRKNRLLGAIGLAAFLAFLLEAALMPNWWSLLIAYAVTAVLVHAVAMRSMARLRA